MEEILHHLVDSLSHSLLGFIHPRCFFTTKQQHTALKFLPRTGKSAFHLRGFKNEAAYVRAAV